MKRRRVSSPTDATTLNVRNIHSRIAGFMNTASVARLSSVSKGMSNVSRQELAKRSWAPVVKFFHPCVAAMCDFLDRVDEPSIPSIMRFAKTYRKWFSFKLEIFDTNNEEPGFRLMSMTATLPRSLGSMRVEMTGMVTMDGEVEANHIHFYIPSLRVQCDLDANHRPTLRNIYATVDVRPGLNNTPFLFHGTSFRQLKASHFAARYALLGDERVCDDPLTNANETIARVMNLNIDRRPVSIPTMLDVLADMFGRPLAEAIKRKLVENIHHEQKHACNMIKNKRVHNIYMYQGPYRPGKPKAYKLLRNKAARGLEQLVSSDELARLERGLRRAVARH